MTYSLVAHDADSGELGVAVQSHWFSVGSIVTWAKTGTGAVATQSIAEPAYGPTLLNRIVAGQTARESLEAEVARDASARFRQVAVVDLAGRTAVHTGDGCIPEAGHVEGAGFTAQANMMDSPRVWPEMAAAFEAASGPLARRLLAALEAGQAAGGDVRGQQSAALLVVPSRGEEWKRVVELRVEDHTEPLAELRRLLDLHDAYELADRADGLAGESQHEEAAALYVQAAEAAPASVELSFWAGLGVAAGGDVDAGAERVAAAIAAHDGWRRLLATLDPEIAPAVDEVRAALEVDAVRRP
jgi:uncharacterized Ntn-hydrolase superfamily protein